LVEAIIFKNALCNICEFVGVFAVNFRVVSICEFVGVFAVNFRVVSVDPKFVPFDQMVRPDLN